MILMPTWQLLALGRAVFHKFAALPVVDHSVGPDFDGLMEDSNRSDEYA